MLDLSAMYYRMSLCYVSENGLEEIVSCSHYWQHSVGILSFSFISGQRWGHSRDDPSDGHRLLTFG